MLLDAAERRELAGEIAAVLSRIRYAYPAVADITVRVPYEFGELILALEPWLFEAVSSLLDDGGVVERIERPQAMDRIEFRDLVMTRW